MSDVPGSFRLAEAGGRVSREGACAARLDPPRLVLLADEGDTVLDLGEIERFELSDYELQLDLIGGQHLALSKMGRGLPGLALAIRQAWRDRLLDCLLAADEDEIARFEGWARREAPGAPPDGPAQLRVYPGHLAVLPGNVSGYSIPLASITRLAFDDASYTMTIEVPGTRYVIGQLARDTARFRQVLDQARRERQARAAHALADVLPFLDAAASAQLTSTLRERQAVAMQDLARLDGRIPNMLTGKAVGAARRPYYSGLAVRVPAGGLHVAFQLVRAADLDRAGDADTAAAGEGGLDEITAPQPDGDAGTAEAGQPLDPNALVPLFSFFFPIPTAAPGAASQGLVVAWEATGGTGRATYFFAPDASAQASPAQAVAQVNAALARIGYRREPIFLSDDALLAEPRYAHYRIAARRVPELAWLRRAFLGRAIHSQPETWSQQVEVILKPGA